MIFWKHNHYRYAYLTDQETINRLLDVLTEL